MSMEEDEEFKARAMQYGQTCNVLCMTVIRTAHEPEMLMASLSGCMHVVQVATLFVLPTPFSPSLVHGRTITIYTIRWGIQVVR